MSEINKDALPTTWDKAKISEIATIIRGVSYKKENARYDATEGYLPILRATNITGNSLSFDDAVYVPLSCLKDNQILRYGDIVIASSSGRKEIVGKAGQFFSPIWSGSFGAFCTGIRPETSLDVNYFGYYFQSPAYRKAISDISAGSNINNIKSTDMAEHLIPIAPLAEQTRIAAKLEELLTDLDTATTELKTAQKKLTQYRQSLLKAAVEGALTAEWRVNNTPSESGSQLLERILKERRARWEQKQLEKFKEQGKIPPKDWQKKYVEPVKPDTTGLMELPEGWVWITADHLISHIETGKSFKCDERTPNNNEIGVVKVSAVSWGEYNELESKTCMDSYRINEFLLVREGDFLFSRANTIELVGACVIAKNVKLQVMLSDKILRFRLVEENLKQWLLFILRSTLGRKQIELLASGNQESMRNIGQEQIRKIALPLPPQAEINHIISSLEQNFVAINEQSISIKTSLKQSAAQRKNILKAAFSGQLVRQDPNDEPASVLLERIKAERAKQEKFPKRLTGRKTAEAS